MAIGKAFDTFAIIVRADTYFIRFMGPMGPTAGSVIGAPIPLLAGAIDSCFGCSEEGCLSRVSLKGHCPSLRQENPPACRAPRAWRLDLR